MPAPQPPIGEEAARVTQDAEAQRERLDKLRASKKARRPVGRPLSPRNRIVYIADLIASGYAGTPRTIWRRVAKGELPKPFIYGGKAAWREATLSKRLDKLQKVDNG